MHFSDVECGKRLFLGTGRPIALGVGEKEIRGSAFLEGPVQMGTADAFTTVLGTLMIAREKNDDDKNQSNKIKPIIGCELNICKNYLDKSTRDNGSPVPFLCKNKNGFHNLSKHDLNNLSPLRNTNFRSYIQRSLEIL